MAVTHTLDLNADSDRQTRSAQPTVARKVCHMTCAHRPDDVRILRKECVSLVKAGYSVHLVAPEGKDPNEPRVNIRYIPPARRLLGRVSIDMMLRLAPQVVAKALQTRSELFHFHDPQLLFAALALKLLGKKVIYDVHEDVPRQLERVLPDSRKKKWIVNGFERFENFVAARVDAVVAATPHIHSRFAPVAKQSISLKNYPLLEEFPTGTVSKAEVKRQFCYVGYISKAKGVLELISAIEKVDAALILAGSFETESLKRHCESMPGWAKVKYLGYLDRASVVQVMSESLAGLMVLHPVKTYIDAMGLKTFEYMAAGLPVICSRFPILVDIVEKNGCGMSVDPLDTDELVQKMNRFLAEPNLRGTMGERGRRAVLDTFNWDQEQTRLLTIYASLLRQTIAG